jgi:DNA-binding NarL/FixJ family response regulator
MKNIFVIEDQEQVRLGMKYLIDSCEGFNCTAFEDAESAMKMLETFQPDVILMDINLPGMNGIDSTRIIRNRYPNVLIMMVTVYEDDEKIFSALKAGANGYILKNTQPEKMVQAITDLYNGGAPMSSQIARKVVNTFSQSKPVSDDYIALSDREKEILNLLADGHRNKEIAGKLFLSAHTVRTHIYNIYQKLHVQSRVEAIRKISG